MKMQIEIGIRQALEYIILGIQNKRYQAAINIAQDCINEIDNQAKKEKEVRIIDKS